MQERGLVHIYTGDGKGKTTAAFGLALRAAGSGKSVQIFQFLKTDASGEHCCAALPNITVTAVNAVPKLFSQMSPEERALTVRELHGGLLKAQNAVCDVLILDEIFWVVSLGVLSAEELAAWIRRKPLHTELVLTGRNAPTALYAEADYITEMRCVKHPYGQGLCARRGIEY